MKQNKNINQNEKGDNMKKDIYEIVTEKIMEQLENGKIPWMQSWNGGINGMPKNLISNKAYRGINVWMLSNRYDSPFWLTYKQAKEAKGNVKKGEKGTMVIFWKFNRYNSKDTETGETEVKTVPMLRYYTVFNSEQCENLSHKRIKEMQEAADNAEEENFDSIPICEKIVANMPTLPAISHGGNKACYHPKSDQVKMPKPESFDIPENYYSILFHELGHSTGHSSRLDRKEITGTINYGSHDYSAEELVAEMTAAFLCGVTGIETKTIDNSAAYIKGWMKSLKDKANKKWIVLAGARAQKAADYIQGIKWEEAEEAN